MTKALTKAQAIIIVVIVIVAVVAGILLTLPSGGGGAEATTPITTPTTTPTLTTTATGTYVTTMTTTIYIAIPTTIEQTKTSTITITQTYTITETLRPGLSVVFFGNTPIRVPYWLKDFADKCKSGEIETIEINFWTQMAKFEEDTIKEVISMFEQEYPCIHIRYTNIPPGAGIGELKNRVKAAVQAGSVEEGVDVFTWAHDWTGELADGGQIVELNRYLPDETLADIRKQFTLMAYEAGKYGVRHYGLPWAAEALALIVNKKLVDHAPETFNEMKQVMEQYYNPDVDTYGIAYEFSAYHIYPWITAFGGYYYDDMEDKVGVNTTGTKEGVKFFIQNILPYMDVSDLGKDYQLRIFTENRAPFIITGPWDIPKIKEALGEDFIVAPIPKIDDQHIPKPYVGVKLLWMTPLAVTSPLRGNATLLFMLWFTLNDASLKKLVDKAGFIPVKKSLLDYVEQHRDEYPVVFGFSQSVQQGVLMSKSAKMAKVWNIGTYLQAIIGNYTTTLIETRSREKAVETAVAMVDQTLDACYKDIMKALEKEEKK